MEYVHLQHSMKGRIIIRRSTAFRYVAVFVVIFQASHCLAQYDSTYIIPPDQELTAGIYSYYQFTMMTQETGNDEIVYQPNSPVGMGLSVSYKRLSLSGGMGLNFLRDPERGKTKIIDFQYHIYGRRFILDLFFQNYKGFYKEEDEYTIIIYPNLRLVQYGIFGQYIFNNRKFSYRASFNQSERQLRSAGSFQLGGGFYYNQISSDSSLVINEQQHRLNNYQFSISGGYIYTWIIKKNFYATIGVSVGLNLGTETMENLKNIEVSPSMFPRISMGYNGRNWSLGMSFVMNRMYVSWKDESNLLFDTGYGQIAFIRRFDVIPGFLKKIKYLN